MTETLIQPAALVELLRYRATTQLEGYWSGRNNAALLNRIFLMGILVLSMQSKDEAFG